MVEMLPRCIATEDMEISETMAKELKKKKIKLLTGVGAQKVTIEADGVHAMLSDGKELVAEKMLVSIGRSLNSENLGLDAAGVAQGARGSITVDDHMQTNVPGIYAIGDVSGGIMLAHTASTGGLVAATNLMGGDKRMDLSCVAAAIFTSPEIASVGLREFQAEERGIKVKTGHFQYRALGKAHAMGEISGFFKLVADASTDKLLGAHIIGAHAADIIHEAALGIHMGLKAADIAETIHAHPTLSEGLMEAAEDVHGAAIHKPKQ